MRRLVIAFFVTNFNGKRNSFRYFIKTSRENFALFFSLMRLRSENERRFIPTLCSLEMKAPHVQKREQQISARWRRRMHYSWDEKKSVSFPAGSRYFSRLFERLLG